MSANPEDLFAPSLASRIAEALLLLLRADPALAAFARGGIDPVELEDLALLGDVRAPALWVSISAESETRQPGAAAELETALSILLLTEHPQTRGTQSWLRSRVAHHVRRLVLAHDGGALQGPQGEPLTEALTAFQRLPAGRLRAQPALVVTPIDVLFRSLLDEATGEPLL